MRSNSTTRAAAAMAMTPRMSLERRAGNTRTRISVIALPMAAGMTRNGTTANTERARNGHPPSYTRS